MKLYRTYQRHDRMSHKCQELPRADAANMSWARSETYAGRPRPS
jgi:hypothetical protein